MPPSERLSRFCARLLIGWLNERYGASFGPPEAREGALLSSDGAHSAALFVAPLWETEAADEWKERVAALEERLDGEVIDGAFVLWVPPMAPLPGPHDSADFVARVAGAARALEPGAHTEVTFPVTIKLGKAREEGGYASVVGGLSRWWTRITENVQGTFQVDSSAVHRITRDGEGREALWRAIGEAAKGVGVGQAVEMDIEEAWTLQRLAAPDERGFAIAGAPPPVDPTDGVLVRRTARRRLQEANEALAPLGAELRAVALIGAYEFADLEGASATIKALDPALYTRFQIVCVLADGDVRPTFLPRSLPWRP
jgi:hypothetical protein